MYLANIYSGDEVGKELLSCPVDVAHISCLQLSKGVRTCYFKGVRGLQRFSGSFSDSGG